MIVPAQASDRDELARLYRRNHPDIEGRLDTEVQHESQTFVARDGEGRIIGVALVSRIAYGVYPYGVIHELEVARGVSLNTIGRSLVEACLRWLTERRTTIVHATASNNQEIPFYQSAGFTQSDAEMFRPVPPRSIRAASQVFA
jgi:GNAT superfamily N-acetyltransferase